MLNKSITLNNTSKKYNVLSTSQNQALKKPGKEAACLNITALKMDWGISIVMGKADTPSNSPAL